MTARSDTTQVRLQPMELADVLPIIRWGIEMRMQLIEEVACGFHVPEASAPGMEEAMKALLRSLGRDRKVDEDLFVDYMRAEMREWWQDFPERQLLTELFRRTALRRAECGSPDSRRRPSHQDGFQIASPLLDDIPERDQFDFEWEATAVSEVLAALWLPPLGVRSHGSLREYIERSEVNRAYFDALARHFEEKNSRGEGIPRPLLKWRQEFAGGRRRRPAKRSAPRYRPVNPADFVRNIQIQFTIAVLQRVGVKPRGRLVSGCRIVSEKLGCSEDNVKRIWNKPFTPEFQKHAGAIATRTGLSQFHATENL